MRQILHAPVDGKHQILAILRHFHRLQILDDTALPVLDDTATAFLAGQQILCSQLEAFAADLIDAGEPDQMCRDLAGRVIAPVLALHVDARDFQAHDLPCQLRRNTALQINELARIVFQLLRDAVRLQVQQSGKLLRLLPIHFQIGRIGPDRLHRRTDRQRLAIPVRDHAAMRRQRQRAAVARITLLLQELFVRTLQVNAAADQHSETGQHQDQQQTATPYRQLDCLLPADGRTIHRDGIDHCAAPSAGNALT